jgi:hypothetical protein
LTTDQVQQSIRELDQLASQMRKWRIVTLLVVLAASFGFGATLIRGAKALINPGPTRDKFAQRFQQNLTNQILPEIKDQITHASSEVVPLVMTEIQNIRLQSPQYAAALQEQFNALKTNVPQRAQVILNGTVGKVVRDRESKVRGMYPNLTEDKVKLLVDNLVNEAGIRVIKVVDDACRPQQESLERIMTLLDDIHKIEADNVKEAKPTMETALVFLDLFQIEIAGPEAATEVKGGAK